MIQFFRDGTKVKAVIEITGLQKLEERYPHFSFETNSTLYAELMKQTLEDNFSDDLEQIRKDAYDSGYKDGRGKKTKKSWFGWTWKFRFLKN